MRPKPFKLTPPPEFIPTEFEDQEAVFDWLAWQKLPGGELAYSSLAGVRLPIGLARKVKRSGNRPGVPDIMIDCARGGYFGFRCELKRLKGGVVAPEQTWWHNRLREEGYYVVVCKGAKAAIAEIERYLRLPPTERPNAAT